MLQERFKRQDVPLVTIVDDDRSVREAVEELLLSMGMESQSYGSTSEFLAKGVSERPGCLILDVRMPGIGGLDLHKQLVASGRSKPVVFMTAFADIPMTVEAMKAGAVDFFTKPVRDQALLDAVGKAIEIDLKQREANTASRRDAETYGQLTRREREILRMVANGRLNKQIAYDLGISQVTVKLHRGNVMRKLAARSIGDLLRFWASLPLTVRAADA